MKHTPSGTSWPRKLIAQPAIINEKNDGIPASWHETRALEYSEQGYSLATEPLEHKERN
jgi:hypothetical protein